MRLLGLRRPGHQLRRERRQRPGRGHRPRTRRIRDDDAAGTGEPSAAASVQVSAGTGVAGTSTCATGVDRRASIEAEGDRALHRRRLRPRRRLRRRRLRRRQRHRHRDRARDRLRRRRATPSPSAPAREPQPHGRRQRQLRLRRRRHRRQRRGHVPRRLLSQRRRRIRDPHRRPARLGASTFFDQPLRPRAPLGRLPRRRRRRRRPQLPAQARHPLGVDGLPARRAEPDPHRRRQRQDRREDLQRHRPRHAQFGPALNIGDTIAGGTIWIDPIIYDELPDALFEANARRKRLRRRLQRPDPRHAGHLLHAADVELRADPQLLRQVDRPRRAPPTRRTCRSTR